ncbi:Hypothetical predicted protein [Lecanosticta acicola]|uniref:Uncharacterized protein n=1 Tax=Lecanosticta acicola TaxID=111012 RepID=A0AAI9EBG6_9PEZI|nr:Hypothetical predicted protein [Lecanosticta acicola]
MESPPAQSTQTGESALDFNVDGPTSSPFVSHVETSRVVSQQHESRMEKTTEEHTMDIFATPVKSRHASFEKVEEDKENIPDTNDSSRKLPFSPKRLATPEQHPLARSSSPAIEARRNSKDSDLMPPPPSTCKPQTPSRRSPHKSSHSVSNTPRATISRSNTLQRVQASFSQSSTSFKAGLDFRASQLRPEDTTTTSGMDDTCFSAFSEVPELTTWARMEQSPTKRGETLRTPGKATEATPRKTRKRTSPSRSPSPTPRRQKTPANHDGTTFLIDFTQQMEGLAGQGMRTPNKHHTQPDLLKYMNDQRSPHRPTRQSYATPAKQNNILNLLDFELPPAPTPRSVPTITVRELESLKSSYLSQISSLKATLSGREAEVESLKRAVNDAERRVGEAQETLREEKNRREYAEQEKAGWEKRGHEVEHVLKSVKEEVLKGEAEKEDLMRKMDESEKRAEDAEARAIRAEERFADALAARAEGCNGGDGSASEEQVQRLVAAQIDAKIEAVSRELHTVYKEKHERKVATLKKSYEARSERKCADLQQRLAELEKQNEELISAKDATFSGSVPDTTSIEIEADLKAQIEEQKAHLARLENEMQTSQQQQEQLMRELQQERIEKGDLVAAVDEMLALQTEQGPSQGAMSVVEDFRRSISRPPSGLRAPGSGLPAPSESRIGRGGPNGLSRNRSNGGAGGKGSLLANIERMGRAGGSAQE